MSNGTPTASEENVPPQRKRWIPLSLRMFVAMLLLLGIGSALWIGTAAYRQHLAIRELRRRGFEVAMQEGGPGWLRHLLGDERMTVFDAATEIEFWGHDDVEDRDLLQVRRLPEIEGVHLDECNRVTDAGLAHLIGLNHLDRLYLGETQMTDRGLAQIGGMKSIRMLGLWDTRISDAGLSHLKRLTQLEHLWLDGTQTTDTGLFEISGLTRLTYLGLSRTRITDDGMIHLRGFNKHLELLHLSGAPVTDRGLVHLREFVRLHELRLDGTQITDSGLLQLKALPSLRTLSIEGTRITDAGLAYLHGMKELRRLELNNTWVTDAGVDAVKRELPKLDVQRSHQSNRIWPPIPH